MSDKPMNPAKPISRIFCDLSHKIEHGMVTYRRLPAQVIYDFLSHEARSWAAPFFCENPQFVRPQLRAHLPSSSGDSGPAQEAYRLEHST